MSFQALPENNTEPSMKNNVYKKSSSGLSEHNLSNSTLLNTVSPTKHRKTKFGDNLITTIDKETLFADDVMNTGNKVNYKTSNNTISSVGLNSSNTKENVFVLECYESPIKKNSNGEKFIQRNSFLNSVNLLSKYQQYYNMSSKENITHQDNDTNNSSFLENPSYIIAKNLINKGWFLLTDHNNIIGNFNSVELLRFLENEFRMNKSLHNVWITDYETDIYFTPKNLYDLLRELVPNLIEMKRINNSVISNNLNDCNLTNTNMSNNNKQTRHSITGMINPNMEQTRRKVQIPNIKLPSPKTYASKQHNYIPSPVNINLQYVNNNINLSQIMYNQKYPRIDVSRILGKEHK